MIVTARVNSSVPYGSPILSAITSAWWTAANTVPNRMTSSTAANTSPPADGVKLMPSPVAAAKSKTASAGKIQADRGIGPCALMSPHP